MRVITVAALASVILTTAAHADTMTNCTAAWKAQTPVVTAAGSYQAWSKTCLAKGYTVPAEAGTMNAIPEGATAQCNDATYSTSKAAKGRCAHHGGVLKVLP
ncbi:MAG TPA: DUF3761 domain-containing protein [Rhizomicrobium sp.]|jgi:hypothetical protein|nr:DUF3761 domain-containing protein [Rhizomicrobium sp.]